MYGENGEVEYGGNMKYAESPMKEMTHYDNIMFSGMSPANLIEEGVSKSEIAPYLGPTKKEVEEHNIENHFFGYYHFWDPQENFYYCNKHNGFEVNEARSEGTYSKYALNNDEIAEIYVLDVYLNVPQLPLEPLLGIPLCFTWFP